MKIMKFTMKQYNTESHSFNQRSGRLDGFVRMSSLFLNDELNRLVCQFFRCGITSHDNYK